MRDQLEATRAIILTAIEPEYKAVRAYLSGLHEDDSHLTGTVYEVGTFKAGDNSCSILIAQIGMGNPNAAAEAERAITHFDPQYAFLVGVAGGRKDVALGDVVAATKVYGYEYCKVEESTKPRPEVFRSSNVMISRARQEAGKRQWIRRIRQRTASHDPRAFVAPIAAGEKIIASNRSAVAGFLRWQYSDAVAVEMEGLGFLLATHAYQSVHAVVVRGISDLLDGKEEADAAGSQDVAARHAAAFAFACLAKLGHSAALSTREGTRPETVIVFPGADDNLDSHEKSLGEDEPEPVSTGIHVITDNWLLHDAAELLTRNEDPLVATEWYAVRRGELANGSVLRGALTFASLVSLIEQIVFCDTIYVMSGWTRHWQGKSTQLDLILPLIAEFEQDDRSVRSAADRYLAFLCRRDSVATEHALGMAALQRSQKRYSGQIINGSVDYLAMSELTGYAYNPHPLRAMFLNSALYGIDNWRGVATRRFNHLVNDSRLRLVQYVAPDSSILRLGCRISSIAMVCLHESSDQTPPILTAMQIRDEPEFRQLRAVLHEVELALGASGGITAKQQIDLLRHAISEVEANLGLAASKTGQAETGMSIFSLGGRRPHNSWVTRLLNTGTRSIGHLLRKAAGTADPNLISDVDLIMKEM